MANNYLITGYWGEPHVTAENDRGINAAIFGAGRYVLPVGEQFRAEYIGNNTIRLYDGKLVDNGAAAGIPVGEYVDVLITNAGQGMKRNDLIAFQYSQDTSTLIESGKFIVIQGAETSGTATDPGLTESDLLSGKATIDQMALWRVSVSGATISAPEQVFTLWEGGGGGAGGNNLLWENEDTTKGFAAQSISLDLTKYSGVSILYRSESSSSNPVFFNTGYIPKGLRGCMHWLTTSGNRAHRMFTATDSGIAFEAGQYSANDTSGLWCVPAKIYGVK